MIVGIDGGALAISDERLQVGVYRVTYSLIQALSAIDPRNTYAVYSFTPIQEGILKALGKDVENRVLSPAIGYQKIRLPWELSRNPVDVFLGISQALPMLFQDVAHSHSLGGALLKPFMHGTRSIKRIGFIYDLGFVSQPGLYGSAAAKLSRQTSDVVKRADHIVTISHASRLDIQKTYGVKLDKISVYYPGHTSTFNSQGKGYDHPVPYFLFVGSLNKTKNIPFILRSFKLFLETAKKPYHLLLVGGDYWPDPHIDETIHALKLEDVVQKLGTVSDEVLAQLYRGAVSLVVASEREGFCIPAGEAMASGTPVVAVDKGAMKEVVGPGGIVVSPATEELFAEALSTISSNSSTRHGYSEEAQLVSARYSWKTFAVGLLDLMKHYADTSK